MAKNIDKDGLIPYWADWMLSGKTNLERSYAKVALTVAGNALAAVQRQFGTDSRGASATSGIVQTNATSSWFGQKWASTYNSAIHAFGFMVYNPSGDLSPRDVQAIMSQCTVTLWRNKLSFDLGPMILRPLGVDPNAVPAARPADAMLLAGKPFVIGKEEIVYLVADFGAVSGLTLAAGTLEVLFATDEMREYPARATSV